MAEASLLQTLNNGTGTPFFCAYVENFQDEICAAVDSVLGIYTRVMLSEIDDVVFKEGGER